MQSTKAQSLYVEAISLNPPEERFQLGFYILDFSSAGFLNTPGHRGLALMEESANLGYAEAQYQMGLYCLFEDEHLSVLENPQQEMLSGVKWLAHAARQNHGDACLVLGDCYSEHFRQYGHSIMGIDNEKSIRYYERGAEADCTNAMCRLAKLYYDGLVEEDDEAAYSWISRACDAGANLWPELGECYMNARGTPKDIPKAIHAFEQSINANERFVDASNTIWQ